MQYDYLIVGCGLFGSVFAREMTDAGKRCLIIDKRNHIGGNVYTENVNGIEVHKYGPHIFHTSDERIWNYVNKFTRFNNFTYRPIAKSEGDIFCLPFNMHTFNKLWGVITPSEAKKKINEQCLDISNPSNLEEFALSTVGTDIYKRLICGYTTKQWGRDPKELPVSIIKRIPLRFTYDTNYFNDTFQGIPENGYTEMVNNILKGIEIRLNTDYFKEKEYWNNVSGKIVYTGQIDELFNYCFGELEYRSLKFKHATLIQEDFQGIAAINYNDLEFEYTRVIEHKHFYPNKKTDHTVITFEYPQKWVKGLEPFYPINDDINNKRYNQYKELADQNKKIIIGGRLGRYKYYDMHQVIASALKKAEEEKKIS